MAIRTGAQYRDSIRDGREVWIDGERVQDVTKHPIFRPIIDVRARIYDMAHEAAHRELLTYEGSGAVGRNSVFGKPPVSQDDWHKKRAATDAVFDEVGGIVNRIGEETIAELWSLHDGRDLLNEVDPRFAANIDRHVESARCDDLFWVSANTDPKGDRAKMPAEKDPDLMLRAVRETDAGIVVRGAKFETGVAYANRAFVKPTIAQWGDDALSDYAVGFVVDLAARGVRMICRSGYATQGSAADYPLSNRCDEIDSLVVFDDVLIPWEDVLFYRHTRAASLVRATLHRYGAFVFVQRCLRMADLMIGVALLNVRQTGLESIAKVQELLATLAIYRETIHAHLVASIACAEQGPGGLTMPNQSLLYTGRVHACERLPAMMHVARELCGGQLCLTPSAASFDAREIAPWLSKYYAAGDTPAADRRKLLAYARDLLSSSYAGHRAAFTQFAQAPHYSHMNAVFQHFDFEHSAGIAERAIDIQVGTR
jgi:4-hydroxyphenylacetate 3-monooxygenase